ncbi:MAG TPA: PEP-CTERM sorting domain-containing protein [Candidatus Acidoferrales bacterium]|nr:PEP-CTERM sorting domain-containing protein [Candidatus Acidoferrales bacterium]
MRLRNAVLTLGLAAFAAAPAFAGNVNISMGFGGPDGPLGTSASYTSGSATITAYGYECSATDATTSGTLSGCAASDLYQKSDGGSEVGLGLAGETDHEIGMDSTSADFLIGLDLSNLLKLGATSITLDFGSWQPGEAYAALGYAANPFLSGTFTLDGLTNTKAWVGNPGTLPGNPQQYSSTFSLNSGDQFLVLLSPCGANPSAPLGPCGSNVTLAGLSATSATPEPGTLALFVTGLLALGFAARRRWVFARNSAN